MSLPFTSVVSYHTNPTGCGVAKFGKQLAERLGVPFRGLADYLGEHPLFSLKWSELSRYDVAFRADVAFTESRYSVFWHDAGDSVITSNATHVFYADPSLGSPGLWCPSLLTPRKRPVRLFSFGMSHKLQTDKYRKVRELLDAAGERYHLRVSVGIHEGTSLDEATKHFDALKAIMGPDHVTILGILSDDAVSEELTNCDYVLAFFEKGLRANNTTVHAALDHGCEVLTNLDEQRPDPLYRDVCDPMIWTRWPFQSCHRKKYTWDALIREMEKACENSASRIA